MIHSVVMPLLDFLRNFCSSVQRQYVSGWSKDLQEIYTTLTAFLETSHKIDALSTSENR